MQLIIEKRNINDIKPYENNPRINDKAVEAVAKSLQEFGFRQPIVVDTNGVIICGHTRWQAAQQMELTEVPVHVADDLSAEQIKAYRLADNKTAELSEWDYDLLPVEISDLDMAGFDLSLLGFQDKEIVQLLDANISQGNTDPDDVPDMPDEAITQPGDIWVLGNHRLMCGDSANNTDMALLLAMAEIDMVFMDPPYGVKVEPRSNNAVKAGMSSFAAAGNATDAKLRAKDRPIQNDNIEGEDFAEILLQWFQNASRVMKPGRAFYICGGYANLADYPKPLKETGLYFSQAIVWDKQHPVIGRKDFMGAYELIFYGWKEGAAHRYFGPNNETDLWHVKKVNPQNMVHLTEKPVELALRALQYSSKPNENVLDLFGGSGSTLIACEQAGRKAYSMEIDPLYCDVIVQRWENFTGEKAKRLQPVCNDKKATA